MRFRRDALLPEPGRAFLDTLGRMLTNALEDIDQVVVRVDLVQPTGGDQTVDNPDLLCPQLGPSE